MNEEGRIAKGSVNGQIPNSNIQSHMANDYWPYDQ